MHCTINMEGDQKTRVLVQLWSLQRDSTQLKESKLQQIPI